MLLLCFLAQVIVSMMRYDMLEPKNCSKVFIIDSLHNLTVACVTTVSRRQYAYILELRGPELTHSQGYGGRFRFFPGLKALKEYKKGPEDIP